MADKSLYIAGSLLNKDRVAELRDKFAARGIGLTYDWTTHGWVKEIDLLQEVAFKEAEGVVAAKCILMMGSGRNGTHFEAGIAWTLKKPIVMYIEDLDKHVWTSFHQRSEIIKVYSEAEALDQVERIIRDGHNYAEHAIDTLRARHRC